MTKRRAVTARPIAQRGAVGTIGEVGAQPAMQLPLAILPGSVLYSSAITAGRHMIDETWLLACPSRVAADPVGMTGRSTANPLGMVGEPVGGTLVGLQATPHFVTADRFLTGKRCGSTRLSSDRCPRRERARRGG